MKANVFLNTIILTALFSIVFTAIGVPPAEAQAGPVLNVNPDTVRFDTNFCYGTPNDPPVSPRGMFVYNSGSGDMTWSGTAGDDWVDFEPKSGGNFDSVLVWIVWQDLPEGSIPQYPGDTIMLYSDITITSPEAENSPQTAAIQLALTCTEAYYLVVQPTSFDFSVSPGDAFESSFFVYEASGQSIEFHYFNRTSWLVLPQTFAALYTPDTVRFMVYADTLSPGVYYDTISVVTSEQPSNSPKNIPVRLHVTGEGQITLVAVPDAFTYTLDAGQSTGGDSLYIYEAGGQAINFWTYNQSSWLSVDTMGSTPLYTPRVLYVNVSAEFLDPGVYTDTIRVFSDVADNSPLLVPVSLIVEGGQGGRRIVVTPSYFNFNLGPDETATANLSIVEEHGDAVDFSIQTAAPWLGLTIEPPYITPVDAIVTVNTENLDLGFYVDTIFIFPTDFAVDPVAVPVYLEINAGGPRLVSVPGYFRFTMRAGDSLASGLWVYEASGDTVPYAVQLLNDSPWLRLDLSFNGNTTTPDSVRFGIFTGGLGPGIYGDTIILYNPLDYGPYYETIVPVALAVWDDTIQTVIRTDPPSLTFSIGLESSATGSLWVYESSGDTVGFYHYNSEPWMAVNPFGMPPYLTPMTIPVAVNSIGLEPGIYVDTIFFESTDDTLLYSAWAVPVIMAVGDDAGTACGDVNGDTNINVGDVVWIINYMFREGSAPVSFVACDVNGNGFIDIGDAVHLLNYIYKCGPPPLCPM